MAEEAMTFDEILADPEYKSEFDRRVTKAISTVQSKLDAALRDNKKYEAFGGETMESMSGKLETANKKLTQYEREKYLTSKGVGADELEFYCFKIGQKVTDTVSFEKAADEFLKDRKPASVRVDMSAHVGNSGNSATGTNDAMNALIRGKFK